MAQSICGLLKRRREDGRYVWHIDKRVRRYGRLCESTGTADREEAERYLAHRIKSASQRAPTRSTRQNTDVRLSSWVDERMRPVTVERFVRVVR